MEKSQGLSFPVPQGYCPLLPNVQCLENGFFMCLSFFVVVYDIKANLALLTPSLWERENSF